MCTKRVQSIRHQTLQGIEIIVVDGGSEDPLTLEAVKALQDEGSDGVFSGKNGKWLAATGIMASPDAKRITCAASMRMMCCFPPILEKAFYLMHRGGFDVVGAGARAFGERDGLLGVATVREQ